MKKIAVFAGSFDPFTLGHEEVIKKTLPLFDKIIIGVGNNINKKYLFSKEKRTNWIKRIYINNKKIEVKKIEDLTVNLCKKEKASYILRGLRNSNDLIFEKEIQETNDILNYNIKTIYIISSSKTSHISSSIIRDLIQNKGKLNGLISNEIIKDI